MPLPRILSVIVVLLSLGALVDAFVAVHRPSFGRTGPCCFAKHKKKGGVTTSRHRGNVESNDGTGSTVVADSSTTAAAAAVDMDRAKLCAENFGKCTVEEMERLKHDLHNERMKNFVLGGMIASNPVVGPDMTKQLILEEELDLQLSLLKEHTPDTFLFPDEKEEMMKTLPHLDESPIDDPLHHRNNNNHQFEVGGMLHVPTPNEVTSTLSPTVLDENVLEPIMICIVILGLALVPQLLN